MPGDLRSGGWQDLNDDSSEGVSSDHAYRGVIMEPMKADDGVQFFKEEVEQGVAVYSVYLKKVNYHTSINDVLVEVGASGAVEDRKAHLQWRLEELRVIRAGTLSRLVAAMTVDRSGELDSNHVNILLATYRTFTTPNNLLTEIINRYLTVGSDQTLQLQSRETCQQSLRSVLSAWLETYPDDFREPPEYSALTSLVQFALCNAFDNDLAQKARDQLTAFRHRDSSERISSGLVDDLVNNYRLGILKAIKHPRTNRRSRPKLHPPVNIVNIDARTFAEQLTYIDAELFKNVIAHHCLGAVWSRRSDRKHPVQPVSVLATVNQFNAISYRVIATVLKSPLIMPDERAEVVEKWIDIAQECRVLKNFSALKAIISALQSHSIFRLKRVWQCVTREKLALFTELADIFNDSDNQKLWRELLNREGTAKFADLDAVNTLRNRSKLSGLRTLRRISHIDLPNVDIIQGTVPYLGTFLTDLTMVDTALKDSTKDGLINFDKCRKEFELMTQIHMLQLSASLYSIEPEPDFFTWFYNIRVYDDAESNELSHAVEQVDVSNVAQKMHRKAASIGFFAPWHREQVTEAKFTRRCSVSSLDDDDDDADTKSVASMHELYMSTSKPEFRHSISVTSMKLATTTAGQSTLSPYQTPDTVAVKVYLDMAENLTTNHYKSILVSSNDHVQTVLLNTFVKYNVSCKPEEFCIVQLLPDDTELPLPDRGNVFYAIRKDIIDVRFVIRRRPELKHKHKTSKHRSRSLGRIIF